MGTLRVLVTGAGRGYGAVLARRFAAAGADVSLLGRDPSAIGALARELGGAPLIADVLDRDALAGTLGDAEPFDVVVNNAGVGGTLGLAWQIDPDDWWRTLEVNVRGTHNVTALVVPKMIEAGGGRIVNVVSNAGVARWPYGSSYAVSKAAVIKYGENLAAELRRHRVAVLNFHPGILEIGLTGTLLDAEPSEGTVDRMVADWFRGEISAGRSIDAQESADKLVRVASGDFDVFSGRYITAYDDLDALSARSAEIAESSAYTLGVIPLE